MHAVTRVEQESSVIRKVDRRSNQPSMAEILKLHQDAAAAHAELVEGTMELVAEMQAELVAEQEKNARLQAEIEALAKPGLLRLLKEKFTSGNRVQVDRIQITRAEYDNAINSKETT